MERLRPGVEPTDVVGHVVAFRRRKDDRPLADNSPLALARTRRGIVAIEGSDDVQLVRVVLRMQAPSERSFVLDTLQETLDSADADGEDTTPLPARVWHGGMSTHGTTGQWLRTASVMFIRWSSADTGTRKALRAEIQWHVADGYWRGFTAIFPDGDALLQCLRNSAVSVA